MNLSISQTTIASYLFVALLGVIILRRAFLLTHGVRATAGRLIALPVVYVALYAVELAAIGFAGVGSSVSAPLYVSFAVDALLVVVGTFAAYRYTLQHLTIYRAAGETDWSYRLSALLPVIYVVLFVARVAIETVLLSETPFAVPTTQALTGISAVALYSLFAVDALWGVSTGFLVGRNAAVYHEWQDRRKGPTASAGTSLP
jgi:hypothetical protein